MRADIVPADQDRIAFESGLNRVGAGLVDAGAVGLNLEDFQRGKLVDLAAQIEKIRAVRRVGERLGVPIVINARTDIYLAQLGDAATRFERTVERVLAYRDAGADCLFIPGVYDQETIAALVKSLQFPLNILGTGGSPTVDRLQELGVARVSLGSGPMRAHENHIVDFA